jgi:hypothetical protein
MDSSLPKTSRLTPLQRELLDSFFGVERGFFLTGGGALAGWHLCHRQTSDLDLFTLDDAAMERARHVVSALASRIGAKLLITQDAPDFRRVTIERGNDGVVVDLVRERVYQLRPDKWERDGILVDPPDEILANKLNTLVSRSEERDLVDVMFLDRAGYAVESALPAALLKDGGCTPAQLAWLLSQIRIPVGISLPAGDDPADLKTSVDYLVRRRRRAALP